MNKNIKNIGIILVIFGMVGIASIVAMAAIPTSNDYKANIYSLDDMSGGTYNSIIVEITDSANRPIEGASVSIDAMTGYYKWNHKTDANGLVVVRFTTSHCAAGGCPMPVVVKATKTVNRIVHTANATKTINLHNVGV